tara:strand:- start:524 stop:979 length:456 start_codon:yes stop_codon:yes gene_type:complete
MKIFPDLQALQREVGREIAVSPWLHIDQNRINRFADATDDQQWIHTDPQRAAQGPFGTTVAHGFLTLSLLPALLESAIAVEAQKMGVNYGLNKVRFPAPVPVDSELQAKIVLQAYEPLDDNGAQCVYQVTIHRRGGDKPVCVAEAVLRHYV